LVVKCLADNDNLVRKEMSLALLIMSEQHRQVICLYRAVRWNILAIKFAATSPSHGVHSKIHFCYWSQHLEDLCVVLLVWLKCSLWSKKDVKVYKAACCWWQVKYTVCEQNTLWRRGAAVATEQQTVFWTSSYMNIGNIIFVPVKSHFWHCYWPRKMVGHWVLLLNGQPPLRVSVTLWYTVHTAVMQIKMK
jgi:hypothetical protein